MLQPVLLMMVMMTAMLPIMVDSGEAERRLLNTLLEQYNKLERPVYNESDPVVLKFGLTLQQIIDVVSNVCKSRIIPLQCIFAFRKRQKWEYFALTNFSLLNVLCVLVFHQSMEDRK